MAGDDGGPERADAASVEAQRAAAAAAAASRREAEERAEADAAAAAAAAAAAEADAAARAAEAERRARATAAWRAGWNPGVVEVAFDDRESVARALVHTTGELVVDDDGPALQLPDAGVVAVLRAPTGSSDAGALLLGVRQPVDDGRPKTLFQRAGSDSLDGDGFTDLFVGGASLDGGPAWSHLSFGAPGGFAGAASSAPADALIQTLAPRGVAVGDVDGDGQLDLLVADNGADAVHVHLGPLCPGDVRPFPADPRQVLAVARPQGLALADLDGDGDLDVAACSYAEDTQPIALFENDGRGGFTQLSLEPASWQAPGEGLALADLDRDGVLDLVYGALDTGIPSGVLLGRLDAHGRYGVEVSDEARRFPLSDQVLGVDTADLDGDGWPDLVLARPHHDQVVIHRNRGGRFEAEPDQVLAVLAPFTVAAGRDLDLDGHPDIAVASFLSGPLRATHSSVLLGPDFGRSLRFAVPAAVSLTAGDLDGDGLDDLLFRSATEGRSLAFLLGPGGRDRGGFTLRSVPSHPGAFGAGVGVFAAAAGSSPYTTTLPAGGELRLGLADGQLTLTVRAVDGALRTLSLPWVAAPGELRVVRASWSGPAGRLTLEVDAGPGERSLGEADSGPGEPFEVGPLAPVFRLGSDERGAGACAGWRFVGGLWLGSSAPSAPR